MTLRWLLLGDSTERTFQAIETSPFEPLTETSPYQPPRRRPGRNRQAARIARTWPLVRAHKWTWGLSLALACL